jgi:hypothetical protein
MLLTKTLLVAAAIAGGLLAWPSAVATAARIPEPPARPLQGVEPSATARPVFAVPQVQKERNERHLPSRRVFIRAASRPAAPHAMVDGGTI